MQRFLLFICCLHVAKSSFVTAAPRLQASPRRLLLPTAGSRSLLPMQPLMGAFDMEAKPLPKISFVSRLLHAIDRPDALRPIIAAVLAVTMLTAIPDAALAKGGGSGGGGGDGGGGGSSYSSSSYRYSPSPPAEPPLPDRWRRTLVRTPRPKGVESYAPWYCWNMPYRGEEIEVLVSPYDRYIPPVYDLGRVEQVSTTSCEFEAARLGSTYFDRYYGNNLVEEIATLAVFVSVPIFFSVASPSFARFSERTTALGNEYQTKRAEPSGSGPPLMASGKYLGETSESDGVVQEASTTLNFQADGRVTGFGYDSEDGSFNIVDGYWYGTKAVWFEKYGSGFKPNFLSSRKAFKVAVRAEYRPGDGTIRGNFCSSVGSITGSFTLRRP